MKNKISLIGLGAASILQSQQNVISQEKKQQPNIILILADDMGYSDLGCYGSEISTPNLDKLASEGLRMTQFYNAARCCPTRASLLTGLYQHQAGVGHMVNKLPYPGYIGHLNNQCVTMAEALKENGYNTYMSGKWHVGGAPENWPRKRGFDHFFGLIDGASNYFKLIPYRNNQAAPRMALDDSLYTPPAEGFYMTNAIGEKAIEYINSEKDKKDKPFFLYLSFTAPHWPLHALPEDIAKYRGKYMKGWDVLRKERYQKMASLGIIDPKNVKLSPRDERSTDWEQLSQQEKEMWDLRMAVYAAMIDRMDQNIGLILKKLEETGEKDNTLIVFLSDNGGCHEPIKNFQNYVRMPGETGTAESLDSYEYNWANASNTPFRLFKHWVHEGGISTPFIAWNPKLIKPSVNHNTGHIIDLMPTFIDICNGKYPASYNGDAILPMEGISLVPAFKGKNLKRKNPIFFEHQGNRAIRDGKWKMVSRYNDQTKKFEKWELYNIKKDRSELENLITKRAEIAVKLLVKYEQWAKKAGVVPKEIIDSKK